jgi:hypothetical protein
MEVNGDKKSTRTCLDISPLLFHAVPKLVEALVITYDQIFQALTVGDILLPKLFLDLGIDGVLRRFIRLPYTWKSRGTKTI